MKIVSSPRAMQKWTREAKRPVVLVPTMGALHRGHLALIHEAKKRAGAGGSVVVSIFVNPTQFGPKEDLSRYPRPFAEDRKLCAEAGVDVIFHPQAADMYAADASVTVQESKLGEVLCGRSRPGHFQGVGTVVAKLFNLVQPDVAVFGRKDFQQLKIIERMVRDLNFPVKIVPVKTVREPDGLALSSRNQYLSAEERTEAPVLRKALLAAKASSSRTAAALEKLIRAEIERSALAKIDYVEILDAENLQPLSSKTRRKLAAVAAFFGRTRLIDNILIS